MDCGSGRDSESNAVRDEVAGTWLSEFSSELTKKRNVYRETLISGLRTISCCPLEAYLAIASTMPCLCHRW